MAVLANTTVFKWRTDREQGDGEERGEKGPGAGGRSGWSNAYLTTGFPWYKIYMPASLFEKI